MEAPSGRPLESHLTACVQEHLALYLYDNAIFMCERLVAEFPSEANVYLLAVCYHRAQQTYRAYHLLKGLQGPQSRYLFAMCCMHLGKLTEAESALLPDNDTSKVPNGAAGLYLLGRIYQLSTRHSIAIAYFSNALQLDPMMWCAYEELCALGADHEAQQYVNAGGGQHGGSLAVGLRASDTSSHAAPPTQTPPGAAVHAAMAGVTGGEMPPSSAAMMSGIGHGGTGGVGGGSWPGAAHAATPPSHSFVTPILGGGPSGPPPIAPRGGGGAGAGNNGAWPPSTAAGAAAAGGTTTPGMLATGTAGSFMQGRKFLDEGKLRKVSSKLFVEPASILRRMEAGGTPGRLASSGVGGGGGGGFSNQAEEAAAMLQTAAVPGVPQGTRSQEGQAQAVALLQLLGEGYRLLCMFRCHEAVDAFSRLPVNHFQTGWVLTAVGRAYYEMVDYASSANAFQVARQVDPYRLKGLEQYSTVLWHMKREVELSHLAQEAVSLDRHSPYAWCVMGNCFSLQKEHETALRFFQRALQLDPSLPYAYTLCGHEYFANEDFEKGITCYRNAIRIDPRHYNAWFGMGHIYYRQEKYSMAEYHFRRAQSINDRSSVLRCYLGMALHKLKRNAEALEALAAAIAADPRNPLARFERALVLAADGRLHEALSELMALRDIAPREASVLFHIGKVLKKLGKTQDALTAFCDALDLQPPSADTNLIKAAIDRVAVADAEEEEDM